MRFKIVITGYNCESWAADCLNSITSAAADHEVFIYVINDGSTDTTESKLRSFAESSPFKNMISIINNDQNYGAAFSRWRGIEAIRYSGNDTDVVLFIDLDDMISPSCLDVIAEAYKGGARLTYGNWSDLKTGEVNQLVRYPSGLIEEGRFASVPFWATAPRSCRWEFVKLLSAEDFIFSGCWLVNCTDVALIYRLFELIGGVGVVPISDPIYYYRRDTGNNTIIRYGLDHKIEQAQKLYTRYL
jgi:glycosyltransferase involved in cell wall biosynthesis